MKKLAVGLIVAGAAVFAGGLVADAYPPLAPAVTVDDPTPEPNGAVVATVTDCIVGETVNFELEGSTDSDVCEATDAPLSASLTALPIPDGGTAVGDLEAPGTPGTYEGTATLVQSEAVLPFTVVVEAQTSPPTNPTTTTTVAAATTTTTLSPSLPATGSNSTGTTTKISIGLVLAGLGLLAVTGFRRRRLSTTE